MVTHNFDLDFIVMLFGSYTFLYQVGIGALLRGCNIKVLDVRNIGHEYDIRTIRQGIHGMNHHIKNHAKFRGIGI